jgi:hypothetical protein
MRTPAGRVLTIAAISTLALLAPAAARGAVSFERTDYAVGGPASSLAVGDIDGKDGPDLVAVRYSAGTLVRRLNDGHGGFTTTGQAYAACPSTQVELADVTSNGTDFVRDGKLDALLFCADSIKLARMAGDGAGGFGAPHLSSLSLNSGLLSGSDNFAVGRFTDYDRPPLVLYSTQDGGFHSLLCSLYDYDADYACLAPFPTWPAIGGPMVPTDFRGDGMQELATLGGTQGVVVFGITSYPLRQWSFTEVPFGHGGGSGNRLLTTGDLRADGHPDLVTGWSTSSEGWVNTIDVTDQGATHSVPREFPSVAGISKLITGDFDGDRTLDVLAATGYGRAVVHGGDGAGGLGGPQDVPLIGFGNPAYASVADAATADVDRNGTADAVVLDESAGQFEVLRNLAPPPPPLPPGLPGPGGGGTPGPKPQPIPSPLPPAPGPLNGVTGLVTTATASKTATITIGKAANPPTRAVSITLTVPAAKASATRKQARPLTIGRLTLVIPSGRSRALTIKLTAKGRSLLRHHARIVATATITATGNGGRTDTRRRTITVKRRAARP